MRPRFLLQLIVCGAITACGGKQAQPRESDVSSGGSAIVVRGADLGAGTVLEGMRTRIPTMMVSTSSGGCPRIVFRGQRSIRNQGNPSVYVDGTLMLDTCILAQIPAADTDYVEVYTSGITSRTGVQRNPMGVILVFRRRE